MTDRPDPTDHADTGSDLEGTVSWRDLLAEATQALTAVHGAQPSMEARWIVEEASGMEGAELVLGLDDPATVRCVAHLDRMVERRLAGEPIQYVLGHWSFRNLDLLVDSRVLIPRPETEQVVGIALRVLDDLIVGRPVGHRTAVVDLGTGSGAIALAIATERPTTHVWAADRSADALAVARANLAALGMAGSRVRLDQGDWFDALPGDLQGEVDLIVSNPPYVAADEVLDASVAEWEPVGALVPGPTGLEDHERLLATAPAWLAPGGAVVLEIGASQGAAVAALAAEAGLVGVEVRQDHAGLDRALVARRSHLV